MTYSIHPLETLAPSIAKGTDQMTSISRRKLVGNSAAAAVGLTASATLAGTSGNASASGSTPFAGVLAAKAQDKPVEITFYHGWGTPPGGEAAAKKHPADLVVEAFNASQTAVKVNAQTPGGYPEIAQKVQAELASGNAPALAMMPWASIYYASEGLGAVPLEDVGGDEVVSTLAVIKPEVLPFVQLDGKTMGLPYALSTPVIYYNTDLVKQAGVDPAVLFKDWSGFAQETPKIKEMLGGNPVIGISFNKDWPAQGIIQSNGGTVLDESNNPVMNSPEAIEAMQMIADLDKAGLYDRGTSKELRPSFVAGSTAILVGSIAGLSGLRNEAAFDLQVVPFPTFGSKPRKMSTGGSFITCFAQDDDQRNAAWQFLKFAVSEEAWKIWMQTGYMSAATWEVPVLEGQEAAYTQLNEGLTRETPWPGARGAEIQTAWASYVERIWANDLPAEESLNEAVQELKDLIATS